MKTAIITGVNGQDGSYLSELLISKNYKVIGLHRRSSTDTCGRLQHILNNDNLVLIECDITDAASVDKIIRDYQPDELYNLAAQSHVATSFAQPHCTFHANVSGVLNILESIRNGSPHTKFYQASTSEMFGDSYSNIHGSKCQNEDTAFNPQSPYAVAKLAAHNLVRIYRDSYGIFTNAGILFNHESERRGEQFVTRKITKWIGEFVRWKSSQQGVFAQGQLCGRDHDNYIYTEDPLNQEGFPKLRLGNLEASRDWGHAEDYVEAMWMMLQQESPDDYVIATSTTYSIREFLHEAFSAIDIDDWESYVVQDPEFYRPCEVEYLMGDTTKVRNKLGWKPKINFKTLVKRMVRSDIDGTERLERPSLQVMEGCCKKKR